ncbi:hypothetical protein GLOIN_2v1475234 [Rhizophagus irregularis DAOM 181602=DAOM 197198]|nr:hypothetical protein GLOIN_2v1475234 [Rhizophagus irregularis DAOM 181602=DAOM 197198]
MEKIIRQQDIFDKASAVRHMCKALEFINKRKKFLVNYTKEHFIYQITQCYENLVLGNCDHLIKFILFGNDDDVNKANKHATDYAGWMSTVSKTLPLLFKYNYDDYIRKLFCKRMFCKSKLPFNTKTQYYYSSKISRKE